MRRPARPKRSRSSEGRYRVQSSASAERIEFTYRLFKQFLLVLDDGIGDQKPVRVHFRPDRKQWVRRLDVPDEAAHCGRRTRSRCRYELFDEWCVKCRIVIRE